MNLSLDSEISRRIGKATGTMSKWTRRAWKTNFRLKTPKCTSTKHAFSASCSTAVKLGPPASDRNAAWTLSTCYASAHLRHQVAIPHPQQWDTVTCWFPQHALPPQSAPPEMAGTCSSHGWWAHPQESFIQTINNRSRESRVRRPAVQRRLETWPQSMRNWSKQLGRSAIDRPRLRRTMKEGTRMQMWNVTRKLKKSAFAAKKALLCLPSTSSSPCAVGTATLALAYTATQEVAEPPLID